MFLKTDYRIMNVQVLQNAPLEGGHSAILSTFIKLQFLFVLSILSDRLKGNAHHIINEL